MASSVNLGFSMWQDGMTVNGLLGRQLDVASSWFSAGSASALAVQSGVINSTGGLQVVQNSGMNITVNAGFAVICSSVSNSQGGYKAGSMVSSTLTVSTADPSNPRIDIVVIGVDDTGDDTGYSFIEIVEGTASSSPSVPATPANSMVLALIAVAAGATSITTSNITDERTYTSSAGGVIPWPTTSLAVGGHPGLIAYDIANDRFFHNKASSTPEQLKSLPWATQVASRTSDFTLAYDTATTITSVNITTDGSTDIEVEYHWVGVYQNTPSTAQGIFSIWCDSTQLDECDFQTSSGDLAGISHLGNSIVYKTSSVTGDTPSAGTHTIYLKGEAGATSGEAIWVRCSATRNLYLRVSPVGL